LQHIDLKSNDKDNLFPNIGVLDYFQKYLWIISNIWNISIYLIGIFPSYEF